MPLLPQAYRGSPFSAATFNATRREVELQGLSCSVRRTASAAAIPPNTDLIVNWQVEDWDTLGGGMFDPVYANYILITSAGIYLLDAQVRWDLVSVDSPYNTGDRAAKILVNSTNVFSTDPLAGPVASDKKAWSTVGEGVTLSMSRIWRCFPGDRIYLNYWHSAVAAINGLHLNYGGTYLSAARLAGLD